MSEEDLEAPAQRGVESTIRGCPGFPVTLLGFRVVGVWHVQRQWVSEDGDGFFEHDPMFLSVRLGLLLIPLELVPHPHILRHAAAGSLASPA